jgi:hypothetical protein
MALTANKKLLRRGPPTQGAFGYQVAPGEQIWGGGIVALNSAGTLQRVQTAGSVVVVGLASKDYSNVGNASPSQDYVGVERGWWQMAVPGATPADIDEPVYATADDTLTLTPPVSAVLAPTNAGNGSVGTVTAGSAVVMGDYQIAFTSASAFNVIDPRGLALAAGTVGSAYSQQGLGFTITAGGTAFAAGDSAIIAVGGLLVGTLAGFDKGVAYVRIKGS